MSIKKSDEVKPAGFVVNRLSSAVEEFGVEFNVLFRGILPAVVAVHGVGGNLQPNFKLRVSRERTFESVHHFMRVVIREDKAVALFGILVVLLNCIFQAASFANDGSRAVTHGDKLTDAAGLIIRRHEENIAGGVNSLRKFVGEIDIRGNFLRITPSQTFEPILVNFIAGAQKNELEIFMLQKFIHHADNEVETLRRNETSDH